MGKKTKFHVDLMALGEEVTGSCHLCVVKFPNDETIKFIIDCGLFQERNYSQYNDTFPFNPDQLTFAAATHNHIDHIGRLPLAVKLGFNGSIYTTELTKLFIKPALEDTCKILSRVAKRNNCKPLYTGKHVENTLNLIQSVDYLKEIQVHENISLTFLDNGHLPGASMILVKISYFNEEDIYMLFTGDYSPNSTFFNVQKIPEHILDLPITIIQESTYATTCSNTIEKVFENNLLDAIEKHKTIIVPVFSLGRSQELMLTIKNLQKSNKLDSNVPIYLDGKLSICYTNIYLNNCDIFKESAKDFLPTNIHFVDKDSRQSLLDNKKCKIILTSSGMGSYGPAPLYIGNYIDSYNALLHFVGYPAVGTLSRSLKDANNGALVKIGGLSKIKHCDIQYTTEFSSHVKLDEILDFLSKFNNIKLLLINHGENECKNNLSKQAIICNYGKNVAIENRSTFYRINHYGFIKELPTRFL